MPERFPEMGATLARSDSPQSDLVTVVIPCFNAAQFLEQTIQSVLAQSYDRLELVVVDDRSTDASADLVRAFIGRDARVRLIEMPGNTGAPAAPRNAGVRAARGTWVAFLDADDLWHPRKLEFQMRVLHESGAQMCSTQMRDLQSGKSAEFGAVPAKCETQRIDLRMQLTKYRTPTSSIVVRRDLVSANPFNEDLRLKAREDTDCFIRVHEYIDHSIKLLYPFVLYRMQQSQISGNKLRMVTRHLNMLKRYKLRSGAGLGVKAYYFTLTHFAWSLYLRAIRRML